MIQLAELRGTIPHNYNFICEIKRLMTTVKIFKFYFKQIYIEKLHGVIKTHKNFEMSGVKRFL